MTSAVEILQVLLELVEIGAMPRQETLPAVLAVVLVDQRLVVDSCAGLRPVVEIVDPAERRRSRSSCARLHAVEIAALPRLAFAREA